MSIGREALRREAKKIYKRETKSVPKRRRLPFSEFFKQYRESKGLAKVPNADIPDQAQEDFNFDDFINVSEVNDDDLEEIIVEEDDAPISEDE